MANLSASEWDGDEEAFRAAFAEMDPDELAEVLDGLPEAVLQSMLESTASFDVTMPAGPLEQAMQLDSSFRWRAHLQYLSDRLAAAVARAEQGISSQILVSMPPRTGKSETVSKKFVVWCLRKHPDWKYGLVAYTPQLANEWSGSIRETIREQGVQLGVSTLRNSGGVSNWHTTKDGEIRARSVNQGLTGFGAHVLIIDDPTKDSIAAHNEKNRELVWSKWGNLRTRREHPSITIIVQTRWHEDDLSGRMLDDSREDTVPEEWETIFFPAIAEEDDVLGRAVGEPLISPLLTDDSPEASLAWWASIKKGMSSYDWNAQYQQRPSPAQGAIFNVDWWKYWTTRPELVSYVEDDEGMMIPDGRVVLLPDGVLHGRVLDSWDLNFDNTKNSDYVVGQRWSRYQANNYLLDQRRGRWDFPETLDEWQTWNSDGIVPEHIIEKKANGAALIAMIKGKFSGIKAVSPTTSKENRARAITSEVEHGNTYLPHPMEFFDNEAGTSWVTELQDELREFPSGKHDDMVDVLTQALFELRSKTTDEGSVSVPAAIAAAMARRKMQKTDGTEEKVKPIRSPLTSTSIRRTPTGGRTRG